MLVFGHFQDLVCGNAVNIVAGQVRPIVHGRKSTHDDIRTNRTFIESAHLAYCLEHCNRMLEVSDMENGDNEFDIGIMSDAVDRIRPASLAEGVFIRHSLHIT